MKFYVFTFNFFYIVNFIVCELNIEELNSQHYGITIVPTPVLKNEDPSAMAITLSSKYGQEYQCTYKDNLVGAEQQKTTENEALNTGVPELLRPLADSPCLQKTQDWWTFEFCYGKYIRQYHIEGKEIKGDVIMLGHYETEFDWNNATAAKKKGNSLEKYHSQHYVNGTVCDLTGKQRKAEFVCGEGEGDAISKVLEPESCVYIIHVRTTKICHHPYLKPSEATKPISISCNPVLNKQQFGIYQAQKERERQIKEEYVREEKLIALETKRRKERSKKEGLSELEELMDEIGDVSADELNMGTHHTALTLRDLLETSINDGEEEESPNADKFREERLKQHLAKKGYKEGLHRLYNFYNQAELRNFISGKLLERKQRRDASEANDKAADVEVELKQVSDENKDTVGPTESRTPEEPDVTQPDALPQDTESVEEFDKGLQDVTPQERAAAEKYGENIKSAMYSKFSELIEEAQREMEREGGQRVDVNTNQLHQQMTQTMETLIKRVKEREQLKDELRRFKETNRQPDEISSGLDDEVGTEENAEELKENIDILSQAMSKLNSMRTSNEATEQTTNSIQDIFVKKVKPSATSPANSMPAQPTQQEENDLTFLLKKYKKIRFLPASIDDAIMKSFLDKIKAERDVKAGRRKRKMAATETKENENQLRIVAQGYYDEEEGTISFSESDSKNPKKKKIKIVVMSNRDDLSMVELDRHIKQQDGYDYIWFDRDVSINDATESPAAPADSDSTDAQATGSSLDNQPSDKNDDTVDNEGS